MNLTDKIDIFIGESTKDDLKDLIKKEIKNKKTKGYIWNLVKKSYRNIDKSKFEKVWNEISESTITTAIEKNTAKGHVNLIGPRKKERKNNYMKRFRYMFTGIKEQGTFEVKAKDLKTARNKIKKQWGIKNLPGNMEIWED